MSVTTWSILMRRTSTKMSILAMAGANGASASSSPGLKAKVSFYGLYFYNEGQVRIWPYDRASGDHTIDVLRRLRAEIPTGKLIVLWDGAPYHRAKVVWSAAASLDIHLLPLPG
jgi:hypothetical protein